MAGYEDTRQKIISTLMGRPVGTEIQPENHQDYALNMLDYIRSLELIATSTLIGVAESNTTPVQPNSSRVCYISGIAQNQTVVFENFIDENGNPISITTGDMEGVFIILLWNTQYWSAQIFSTNIISQSESATFYYRYNIRKTYESVALMNADVASPIGTDGKYIKIGDIVTVVNSTTPSENGIYSYEGATDGWKYQSSFNFQLEQIRSQNTNTAPSSKLFYDETNNSNENIKRIPGSISGIIPIEIYSYVNDSLLLSSNGGITNSQYTLGFGVSDYIAVTPMQYITILNGLVQAPSSNTCYISFYSDNNGTFVSSISEGDGATTKDIYNKLIQVPATATYMRLSLKNKNYPAFFITSKNLLTLLNETKNELLDLITHNSIISDAVFGNDLTKYAKNGYYKTDGTWVGENTAKTILINPLVPILRLKLDNITSFAANSVVLKLVDPDTLAEIKTVSVSDLTSIGSNNYYYDLITDAQRRYGIIIQYGVNNLSNLKVYLTNPLAKKVIDLSNTVSSISNSIAKNEKNLSRIATFTGAETLNWTNYTETGYWSIVDGIAALKVGYNYFSTVLKAISPGTVIHFSGLSYEGTLWKAAQIMYLYNNERASIGNVTPASLTIDTQGNADYTVPAGVGYIGFSWTTDYPLPNISVKIGNDDFTLSQEMENKITDIASEVSSGSSVDTANYYLKGNSEKTTNTKKVCIIAGGQSNMNGAIPISELTSSIVLPMPNCHYNYRNTRITSGGFVELAQSSLYNNNWAVDLSLYDKLCNLDGREIYVMKTSYGGVGIDPQGATGNLCWTADYETIPLANSLIRVFENQIRELTSSDGANFDIKAFIWHQGEGDSVYPVSTRYYDNLRKVISYIRGVTGKPALPFIFGTISHNSAQYSSIVEDAMLKIASEDVNVYLVDMSKAVLRDSYHFNAAWAVYLGQKMYDCLIDCKAITGTKINPSEPV